MAKTTIRNNDKSASTAKVATKYTTDVATYSGSRQQLTSKMISSTPYATIGNSTDVQRGRYVSTSSAKQEAYRALNSVLTGSKLKYR